MFKEFFIRDRRFAGEKEIEIADCCLAVPHTARLASAIADAAAVLQRKLTKKRHVWFGSPRPNISASRARPIERIILQAFICGSRVDDSPGRIF